MDVDPAFKYTEKFRGGIQWYMMDTKDFISSINFKLKNENGNLVSFNGQSITSDYLSEKFKQTYTYKYKYLQLINAKNIDKTKITS